MAKTKKVSKVNSRNILAESPVTVGGGGGTFKVPMPLIIRIVPGDWTYDAIAGTLTLANGNCKRVTVSTASVQIKVPLTGEVEVELKCTKP